MVHLVVNNLFAHILLFGWQFNDDWCPQLIFVTTIRIAGCIKRFSQVENFPIGTEKYLLYTHFLRETTFATNLCTFKCKISNCGCVKKDMCQVCCCIATEQILFTFKLLNWSKLLRGYVILLNSNAFWLGWHCRERVLEK